MIPLDDTVKGGRVPFKDLNDLYRFRNILADFEHFADETEDPFAPCGFLHKLLDTAIDRAYLEAYKAIGKAECEHKMQAFIDAAAHLKRCKDLSNEMTDEISAAMGRMHCGDDRGNDMIESVRNLMGMIEAKKQT